MRKSPEGRIWVSRQLVSYFSGRSEAVILRHCQPVAYDLPTGAFLYDLELAEEILAAVPLKKPEGTE